MLKESFGVNRLFNKGLEIVNKFRGWKTEEKIVVFESDDWGSIRTSSLKALNELESLGLRVKDCHYMLYDCLEDRTDLENLFEVLSRHKDHAGQHPIFTFNTIVGNPDFEKIKSSGLEQYFYEPFTMTYEKQGNSELLGLWKEAMEAKIIKPQLHGREHVNTKRWLADLKAGRRDTLLAFSHNMFGISSHVVQEKRGSYLAVFDEQGENEQFIKSYMSEGMNMFKQTFGYSSNTFIPPNYIWNSMVENAAREKAIYCMQGALTQILPSKSEHKQGVLKNYVGKKSDKSGMGYLVRNVSFEPSSNSERDWVSTAMREVDASFRMKRPAIIDTHRVNYMGSLNPKNRDKNLEQLDEFIRNLLGKWPDISFQSSDSLAAKIYRS